ncbi:MAG: site-specific DNA-methyltransferase [Ruminococcus sp.]|nr:site-specific DNA-methyltransferase [Ruminococcus sp.]
MNEIETFGTISLVNADCLDVMAGLPDNVFDLAIVDPPYGIGIDGQKACTCKNPKHNRKHHETKGWDKLPPPIYFAELQRVSKNQIIWGANYFVPMLDKGTKGWIVWFKGQTGLTMSDCELAYSSFDCPTRLVTINRCELAKQQTIHPTEKPKSLYGWLLNHYAKPGDKILDTHLGSGSICLAAHDLNFEMLGIELDAGYYQAAKQRLLYHQQQLKLF